MLGIAPTSRTCTPRISRKHSRSTLLPTCRPLGTLMLVLAIENVHLMGHRLWLPRSHNSGECLCASMFCLQYRTFTAPWEKLSAESLELATLHGQFSLRISNEIERPLRDYARTHPEWQNLALVSVVLDYAIGQTSFSLFPFVFLLFSDHN